MGVKVTLFRTSVEAPRSGRPVERLFEDAIDWVVVADTNLMNSFLILREEGKANDFKERTIAQFPASSVESVEFA